MIKLCTLAAAVCMAAAAFTAPSARADAWTAEGVITVPAGVGTVTNQAVLSGRFLEIDRIALYSELAVTSAVACAVADWSLFQPVASFDLGAAAGTNKWPVRVEAGTGYTNVVRWTAAEVRFIREGPTNAVDSVIRWRVYGRR